MEQLQIADLYAETDEIDQLRKRVRELEQMLQFASLYVGKASAENLWPAIGVPPARALARINSHLKDPVIDESFDELLARVMAEQAGPHSVLLSEEAFEALKRLALGQCDMHHDPNDIASAAIIKLAQQPAPDDYLDTLLHIWGEYYKSDPTKAAAVGECMEALKALIEPKAYKSVQIEGSEK